MRYTKYNYKKKKNNDIIKFVLSFIGMSVFVVIIGVLLANVIIYFLPLNNANAGKTEDDNSKPAISENTNNDVNSNEVADNTSTDNEISGNSSSNEADGQVNVNTSFAVIQCGYFSTSDNANVILSKINKGYGSFIFKDGDKYKVLAGIYPVSEVETTMNNLKSSGIECIKVTLSLNSNDEVQKQVSAICDGYLKILNTTFKSDVTSVLTEDFKSWVENLDDINDGEGKDILKTLKGHIKELPEEIKEEDVANEMQFIYSILLNFN